LMTQGKVRNIDVMRVNDRYSVHLSDLGFNANLIRKFEMSGGRGKWNYARHFFRVLQEQSYSEYSILLNGELLTFKAQMVAFANARRYGTGAVINPHGRWDDGMFEICIFKPYPWYALLGITWRFFTGNIHSSPYVQIISTREALVMVNPEEILQIDGEVIGSASKVEVSISNKPFQVITG
jgi:diacylglycerol kinase (ATP)